jgi:putative membrane-bound dehydrogenase-like protein
MTPNDPRRLRSRILRTAATLACVAALAGATTPGAQRGDRTPIDTAPPPAHWEIPPAPVLSPGESIAQMELPPGFRVELVAAEPLVQDPIAFSFDPQGRLWVLEWPAYNWELRPTLPDADEQAPPPSRVVVLVDTEGDGRMDTRTVFAEVGWPRGILAVGGGVLVFDLPDVVFLRDTTGDGRADHRQVVYGGLPIPVNPHSAPSSPVWAVDNWIYALQTDARVRYGHGGWRVEPAGRMGGQWGLSQDDYGRLFFGYNQDHLRGSLVPVHYAPRNPNYPARGGVDVRIGMDQTVWPHGITAGVNRRAHLRDDGRLQVFTANAGPSVYRAEHFPPEFQGNVFIAESAGRFVRRAVLSEEDGVITGRNAYDEREFLFSHDERFRPVFTAVGPDGALYVSDMYRGIIEGYISVTTFLRNQILDRALHQPFQGMGRIYRIVHGERPFSVRPGVAASDAAGWLPHLSHPDGFWRDAAQRAIVEAGDVSVVAALRELVTSAPDARARLHAFWTLEGLGAIDERLVREVLRDGSPHVRSSALRLAEPFVHRPETLRVLLTLMDDPEVAVRRQVVFSLGASDLPHAEAAMVAMLRRDGGRPFVVDAALSGLAGREAAMLDRVIEDADWQIERPGVRELLTALATAIANEGVPERVDRAIGRIADDAQPIWRRLALLEGMEAAAVKHLHLPPPSVSLLRSIAHPALREKALTVVGRVALAASERERPVSEAADPELRALIERGRTAYAICAACHQADGRGLTALAPPLRGTARVTGAPEVLIDIVLNGRDEDRAFPSMPPLAGLPDDQIAAILTYIRQAWDYAATPVSAEQVRMRRSGHE